jgi:hypothetical protein
VRLAEEGIVAARHLAADRVAPMARAVMLDLVARLAAADGAALVQVAVARVGPATEVAAFVLAMVAGTERSTAQAAAWRPALVLDAEEASTGARPAATFGGAFVGDAEQALD